VVRAGRAGRRSLPGCHRTGPLCQEGEFRDIPLPHYVGEAIDKHGTTPGGYVFQGRKYKLVVRRSYQEDFQRAAAKQGCRQRSSPLATPPLRLHRLGRGHPDH
jgi:hypothetical protein